MADLWSDLLECLQLSRVPSGGTGDVVEYEGRDQRPEYHRVFGGQLVAQFIRIASAISPDKAVKSQHVIFDEWKHVAAQCI